MRCRPIHMFCGVLAGVLLVLAQHAPAEAKEPETFADVCATYGLVPLRLNIGTRFGWKKFPGHVTAGIALRSRHKLLTKGQAQQAAERLRAVVQRMVHEHLTAVEVQIFDPSRGVSIHGQLRPPISYESSAKEGIAFRTAPSSSSGSSVSMPVEWYARSFCFRSLQSAARKGVVGEYEIVGALDWGREDWWCEGNTRPLRKGRETKNTPTQSERAVGVGPSVTTPDAAITLVELAINPRDWLGAAGDDAPASAFLRVFGRKRPLGRADAVKAGKELRETVEALGFRTLWAVAIAFFTPERYDESSATVPFPRLDQDEEQSRRSIVRLGLTNIDKLVDANRAVRWYAYHLWHKPVDYTEIAAPPSPRKSGGRSVRPRLRWRRAFAWKLLKWSAKGNALPVVNPRSVTLYQPVKAR